MFHDAHGGLAVVIHPSQPFRSEQAVDQVLNGIEAIDDRPYVFGSFSDVCGSKIGGDGGGQLRGLAAELGNQ